MSVLRRGIRLAALTVEGMPWPPRVSSGSSLDIGGGADWLRSCRETLRDKQCADGWGRVCLTARVGLRMERGGLTGPARSIEILALGPTNGLGRTGSDRGGGRTFPRLW